MERAGFRGSVNRLRCSIFQVPFFLCDFKVPALSSVMFGFEQFH